MDFCSVTSQFRSCSLYLAFKIAFEFDSRIKGKLREYEKQNLPSVYEGSDYCSEE